MRLLITSLAAAASMAVLGLCSGAQAQGISIGPGGVGIDTGIGIGRGYRGDRRDFRDGDYRHRRDYGRRDHGYDRHRFGDRRDRGGDGYRRHRHEQDGAY